MYFNGSEASNLYFDGIVSAWDSDAVFAGHGDVRMQVGRVTIRNPERTKFLCGDGLRQEG